VEPNSDDSISTLADLLPNHVIVEGVFVAKDHAVVQGVCLLLDYLRRRLHFGLVRHRCIVHVLSLTLLELGECVLLALCCTALL